MDVKIWAGIFVNHVSLQVFVCLFVSCLFILVSLQFPLKMDLTKLK